MRHSCVRLFFFFVVSAILNVSGVAGAGFPNKAVSLPHNQGNILQFRSGGHVLGFTPTKVYMVGLGYALIEEFVGTSGVMPVAAHSKDTGQAHGPQRWEKGAPSFHGVSYAGLWEGITVRYDRVSEGLAESVYVIDPGANPEKIRVRYNMDFEIQEDGQLRLRHTTKKGYFTLSRPRAWQEIGGRKVSVDVAFKKYGDRTLGFVPESWDPGHPLMIDPTYQWHTLYGSGSDDVGHNIAVTGDGVYVTGESRATWDVNGTGPKHAYSGSIDIFALKLDLNGNYQWHTFYGSGSNDVGFRIAVTGDGVYVIGYSFATWNVDSTGPLHAYSGMYDIVVLKLNTGGTYQWHTFYGSGDNDSSSGIAVTGDGVYATGYSYGTWDVDGTGPLHAYSGSLDIFALKLNTNGTYLWHTFYGSAGEDRGRGIAVTGDGVYVTGYSEASWDVDGAEPLHAYSGASDIVVLKLTDPKPPTPVPTLGEWGMGIMILLLGLTSFVVLRRRGISMRN